MPLRRGAAKWPLNGALTPAFGLLANTLDADQYHRLPHVGFDFIPARAQQKPETRLERLEATRAPAERGV